MYVKLPPPHFKLQTQYFCMILQLICYNLLYHFQNLHTLNLHMFKFNTDILFQRLSLKSLDEIIIYDMDFPFSISVFLFNVKYSKVKITVIFSRFGVLYNLMYEKKA